MSHRDDFADHCEVFSGIQGNRHERQLDVEQLGLLLVEPGAIVFTRVVPIFELYDDLDALLLPHGANAEQCVDVDQSNAPDLHIVPRYLVPPADEHIVAAPGDVHDVVGDEAVPPLHQIEHAFALADPGTAAKQQADAEYVGQGAMNRRPRCEGVIEEGLEAPVELGGLEPRADDRDAPVAGELHQLVRRLLRLGEDHTRQVVREARLDRSAPRFRIERGEIRDFGFAEDVNPIGADEARRVAGEHEAGTGRLRRTNLALESFFRGQQLELQRIALAGEQVADFEHLTSEPWTGGSYGGCAAL